MLPVCAAIITTVVSFCKEIEDGEEIEDGDLLYCPLLNEF